MTPIKIRCGDLEVELIPSGVITFKYLSTGTQYSIEPSRPLPRESVISSTRNGGPYVHRDMDLVRELMFRLEALPVKPGGAVVINPYAGDMVIEGKTPDEVQYHLGLLDRAGLIECGGGRASSGGIVFSRLTWDGHDFVDSVRTPGVWAKVKQTLEVVVGGFTIKLVKDTAEAVLRKMIEDNLGLPLR